MAVPVSPILIDFRGSGIGAVPIPINRSKAAIGAALITIKKKKTKIRAVPTALYVKKFKVGMGNCLPFLWLQAGVLYQKTTERGTGNVTRPDDRNRMTDEEKTLAASVILHPSSNF